MHRRALIASTDKSEASMESERPPSMDLTGKSRPESQSASLDENVRVDSADSVALCIIASLASSAHYITTQARKWPWASIYGSTTTGVRRSTLDLHKYM